MKLSIIIPTYNNFDFLKCTYDSIIKNSKYQHEIIFHINDGSDGTLEFAKKNKIFYTYSSENIGLCKAANLAASKSNTNLILYSHDDMFFCKDWDIFLEKELILRKKNNLPPFTRLIAIIVSSQKQDLSIKGAIEIKIKLNQIKDIEVYTHKGINPRLD